MVILTIKVKNEKLSKGVTHGCNAYLIIVKSGFLMV
jgi:hypothetical protein